MPGSTAPPPTLEGSLRSVGVDEARFAHTSFMTAYLVVQESASDAFRRISSDDVIGRDVIHDDGSRADNCSTPDRYAAQ